MEEVDNIIVHSLREIGCDIEERVTNLKGFDTESVVEATVRCLEIIRPGLGISRVLPANMAARFRVGAALAQACSDLGYRGDIGYQTFLYSSESDLRRVFMFLVEKLPKESDKTASEPSGEVDRSEKLVGSALSRCLSSPWLPHYCHRTSSTGGDGGGGGYVHVPYATVDIDVPSAKSGEDFRNYRARYQRPLSDQTAGGGCLLASILSRNARQLHSRSTSIIERLDWLSSRRSDDAARDDLGEIGTRNDDRSPEVASRFALTERLHGTITADEDEIETERETVLSSLSEGSGTREERRTLEIERIRADCDKMRNDAEVARAEIRELTDKLQRVTNEQLNDERELAALENEKIIKSRTYDLLEDSDNNIAKLKTVIDAGRNKLMSLASQWEKHRAPLIKQYRDGREKYFAKTNSSQKRLEELRTLREKEKELLEECHAKDQQYSQLLAEVEKLPKDVNRSAYTQRILEIINNVRKQKNVISKVLADTREIQKDINTLTGRLERSFTVVDELIFRDAKSNEASRRAYKLLATLHSDCTELVAMVEETGATLREIRDLEEQIDSEHAKNVGANLERITADLTQMRQETSSLTAQLENKKS